LAAERQLSTCGREWATGDNGLHAAKLLAEEPPIGPAGSVKLGQSGASSIVQRSDRPPTIIVAKMSQDQIVVVPNG
jgi:hypothetical protein